MIKLIIIIPGEFLNNSIRILEIPLKLLCYNGDHTIPKLSALCWRTSLLYLVLILSWCSHPPPFHAEYSIQSLSYLQVASFPPCFIVLMEITRKKIKPIFSYWLTKHFILNKSLLALTKNCCLIAWQFDEWLRIEIRK